MDGFLVFPCALDAPIVEQVHLGQHEHDVFNAAGASARKSSSPPDIGFEASLTHQRRGVAYRVACSGGRPPGSIHRPIGTGGDHARCIHQGHAGQARLIQQHLDERIDRFH